MENSSFLFGQNSHDIGGEQQETVRYQLDLKQDTEEYSEFDYLKIVKNKVHITCVCCLFLNLFGI